MDNKDKIIIVLSVIIVFLLVFIGKNHIFSNIESKKDIDNSEVQKITENKNEPCDTALEEIYREGSYAYFLPCIKSERIIVTYKDGKTENLKKSLEQKRVKITQLDDFNIDYYKYLLDENNNPIVK